MTVAGDYGDILAFAYGLCAVAFLGVTVVALFRWRRLPARPRAPPWRWPVW